MPDRDAVTAADIAYHAATAEYYEKVLEPIYRPYTPLVRTRILDSIATRAPGHEAVDLGCGTGVITIELAARGFHVQGIDHSPDMLAIAERRVREAGLERAVELRRGDVFDLPFGDASVDVVTCQGVLHHLHDVGGCLREASRVLKPGGLLYFSDPCEGRHPGMAVWGTLHRIGGLVRRLLGRRADPPVAPEGFTGAPDHDEGPIEPERVLAAAREQGFEPEAEYWTLLDGLHRVRPAWAHALVIRAFSQPWRRRAGNLMVVVARKR